MTRPFAVLLLLVVCPWTAMPQTANSDSGPGKIAATWKPGGDGRWDYLTDDPDTSRLFVVRGDRVQVIDTKTGKLLGEVPGLTGGHGVALAPGVNRGFATSGRDSKVIVFDASTLKPAGDPITVGTKPDAIVYDPKSGHVFVMDGGSDDVTVIDPASSKVVGKIALPGAPEFAVADGEGHLFVNLEDKDSTCAIDTGSNAVVNTWPLAPGKAPTGLALDGAHRRLFAGCANQHLIVLDAGSGKVVGDLPIGKRVDATAFDPGTGLAFSSNGEGNITVIGSEDPDHYRVVKTIPTRPGARTAALDPKTHMLYTCTSDFGPPEANGRPAPLPGSFVVLQVAP